MVTDDMYLNYICDYLFKHLYYVQLINGIYVVYYLSSIVSDCIYKHLYLGIHLFKLLVNAITQLVTDLFLAVLLDFEISTHFGARTDGDDIQQPWDFNNRWPRFEAAGLADHLQQSHLWVTSTFPFKEHAQLRVSKGFCTLICQPTNQYKSKAININQQKSIKSMCKSKCKSIELVANRPCRTAGSLGIL